MLSYGFILESESILEIETNRFGLRPRSDQPGASEEQGTADRYYEEAREDQIMP